MLKKAPHAQLFRSIAMMAAITHCGGYAEEAEGRIGKERVSTMNDTAIQNKNNTSAISTETTLLIQSSVALNTIMAYRRAT